MRNSRSVRCEWPGDQQFGARFEPGAHLQFRDVLPGFLQTFGEGRAETDRDEQRVARGQLRFLGNEHRLEELGMAALVNRRGEDDLVHVPERDGIVPLRVHHADRVPGLLQFGLREFGDPGGLALDAGVDDQDIHCGSSGLATGWTSASAYVECLWMLRNRGRSVLT